MFKLKHIFKKLYFDKQLFIYNTDNKLYFFLFSEVEACSDIQPI